MCILNRKITIGLIFTTLAVIYFTITITFISSFCRYNALFIFNNANNLYEISIP